MFSFPTQAYLLSFIGALAATVLAVPMWRAWCLRYRHVDDPGHRKIHATPVPLAGGLAVFTGLTFVVLAGVLAVALGAFDLDTQDKLQYGLQRRALPLTAIWLGALAMLLLGTWDDRHELSAAVKFTGQCLIALLVAGAGVRITLFVPSVLFSYIITVLWMLTIINSMNFTDNMNGLCAGLGVIGSVFFGWIAARHGQYLVALLAWSVSGALLGYLPYNFPRARVFLGDAGSHLTGYLLAILAMLPHFYSPQHQDPRPLAILTPLFVLGIPLIDLVRVVWIRTRSKRPFWIGDTNHLSHRLVAAGLSRTQAVLVLWLAACLFGGLSLF